ncbi:MAG: hypothetical protein ACM3PS_07625 [Syntrophothermus sp.]
MAQTQDFPSIESTRSALPARHSGPGLSGWLLLGLVLLAAFALRVYRLGSFPDTVLADEADNAQDSIRILYGQPPPNGFFGLDWTSQPAFSAYKEAAFLAVFGINVMAMRLSSAILSTLALLPFHLLLRRQLSIPASLLGTILLATDVWYLNFSRSGWNCIDICFYMLMAMLFLMWGLDALPQLDGAHPFKWMHFAAAGFFCALGLYGYPAGRAITLAVIAFAPIALLFNRRYIKRVLLGYGLLLLVEAVVFAPQALYIARNWEHFNGRSSVVLIFNDPEYQANPSGTLLHQMRTNLRGPWDGRVNNTAQYSPVGEPQLDRITGLLTLAGMLLTFFSAARRRQPETWLWWLMLLAGWVLTQLFTVHTPNGARGIGYMPTLVYFAGVSLDAILLTLLSASGRISSLPVFKSIPLAAVSLLVLFAGYANVTHYIRWQNTPRTRQDRYLYLTVGEFPAWAKDTIDRAIQKQSSSNVGQWREAHPIQDIANP